MTADELGVQVQETIENLYHLDGEVSGDEYYISCPNPGHIDRNPSCSVNMTTGLWNCFACGTAGDLITLGRIVLKKDRSEVEQLLKPSTAESLLAVVQRKISNMAPRQSKKSIELPGPYDPGPLTALRRRGFAQETLERWGVRYVHKEQLQGKKNEFTIAHTIAIPIRDANGRLLCWCYRKTDDSPGWQPRYMYTPEVPVAELWFGLQHHAKADEIVIVEGALDTMWLDQCGVPALGLLGSQMTNRKLGYLLRYRRATIMGDLDSAGANSVQRIGEALASRMPVRVCRYASWMQAKDPQELAPIDVEIAIARAVPFTVWSQDRAKKDVKFRAQP